jgi:thioredoxin 1
MPISFNDMPDGNLNSSPAAHISFYPMSFRRMRMSSTQITHTSDAAFEKDVLKSDTPVLVDFWAEWCGPCKAIGPTVDAVAAKFAGQLKVAKVNVDHNGATPSRYGIRGIPALLLFKDGKVADQIVGYVPQTVIEEKVQRLLAPVAPAPANIA